MKSTYDYPWDVWKGYWQAETTKMEMTCSLLTRGFSFWLFYHINVGF